MTYDKRFFRFANCIYKKSANKIVLVFLCRDNYESEIPALERSTTKQVLDALDERIKIEFEYKPDETPITNTVHTGAEIDDALKELHKYSDSLPAFAGTNPDKTLKVSNMEYMLGRPINIRPIKIKYLKVSKDDQVTAGTIHFLKKREYKRPDKESGAEVAKPYWTFMLDDGESQIQCVYFPSQKTYPQFDKLVDRMAICVIGTCENFRDQKNFRVSGVSLCDL